MGPIVFSDPAALTRLNAIVWPEIAKMAREKAASLWKVPQKNDYHFDSKFQGRERSGGS